MPDAIAPRPRASRRSTRCDALAVSAMLATTLCGAAVTAQPLPDVKDARVTLPLSELRALAAGDDTSAPASVAFALGVTHLAIALDSAESTAERRHGQATLRTTVRTFGDGLHEIPLLAGGTALRTATLGGHPAMLVGCSTAAEQLCLLVEGRVDVALEATWDLTLVRSEGRQVAELPHVLAPTTTLTVRIPEPGLVAHLNGQALRPNPEAPGTFDGAPPPGASLTLTIEPLPPAEASGRRLEVFDHTRLDVRADVIAVQVAIDLDVRRGHLDTLDLRIPEEADGLAIQGDGLLATHQSGELHTLTFKYALTGAHRVMVTFNLGRERPATFDLPEVEVEGADLERGTYAVWAEDGVAVEVRPGLSNIEAIDSSELPPTFPWRDDLDNLLYAFKYFKSPVHASLSTTRHVPEEVLTVAVHELALTTVLTREGNAVTSATWEMVNNGQQFLAVELPQGAQVWSAFVGGRGVKPSRDAQGRLLVPIRRSTQAGDELQRFVVELTWLHDAPPMRGTLGDIQLEAPRTDLVIRTTRWDLYVPDGFQYYAFTGDMVYSGEVTWAMTPELEPIPDRFVKLELPPTVTVENKHGREQVADGVVRRGMARGLLPVRLDVPTQGVHHHLDRSIVEPGERMHIELRYLSSTLAAVASHLSELLLALLMLCAVAHGWRSLRDRSLPFRHPWFAVTLVSVIGLAAILVAVPVPFPPLLGPALAVLVVLMAAGAWKGAMWLSGTTRAVYHEYIDTDDDEDDDDEDDDDEGRP